MFRLCLARIVNKSLPKASTASSLRPIVVSRLSTRPKNFRIKDATSTYHNVSLSNTQKMSTLASEKIDTPQASEDGERMIARAVLARLDKAFNRFEELCQRSERVTETNFVRTFDTLTRAVEELEQTNRLTDDVKSNLSVLTAMLLRCCGSLMCETPEKVRELLAGNLWTFIKEKNIPLDISHYNGLIRVLNENNTNYDPQKMLDEITNANLTPDRITYQRLIHQYCIQGNIDGATQLLETMKDAGMGLNELTFASLIIGYSKQESPPAMSEMFELMRSNGVEPNSRSYTAAIVSQANILAKKKDATDELKNILEMLQKEEIQFSTNEVIDIMTHLAQFKQNEDVAKLLHYINKDNGLRTPNDHFRLTHAFLRLQQYEEASKLYWSQRPTEAAVRYSNLGMYYIRFLASTKFVPIEHVIEECAKLKDKHHNNKAFYHLFYNAAKTGNLKLVKAAIERIKEDGPPSCHFYWPLLAQSKDEATVIEILKNDLSPQMRYDDLLDTFSQWIWPRFGDNMAKLFEICKQEGLNYDNNLLVSSLMKYSIAENKIIDAVNFIAQAGENLTLNPTSDTTNDAKPDSEPMSERGDYEEPFTLRRRQPNSTKDGLIGRLLDQIAEQTKDPAIVEKAFNMCHSSNQQISNRSLNALVKVHILNGDINKAMEVFTKLSLEHRATPCKRDLITHCLENKDPDNLQKIMNISSEIHGEMNSLFDLAVCCLQCGKLKQAQKIFASPGFRVQPFRVYETCRSLADNSSIDILENFVHLTRDMCDINQEQLHQILINTYERTSNAKRVLDLWNRMQEEDFYPSKRSLIMIARVLEKNNIEVPFQKPLTSLDGRQ